jgi:hypothetical protein
MAVQKQADAPNQYKKHGGMANIHQEEIIIIRLAKISCLYLY